MLDSYYMYMYIHVVQIVQTTPVKGGQYNFVLQQTQ